MVSIAIAQQTGTRYTIHVFENQTHFLAWMKVHHKHNMRPASQAKGCKAGTVNHVGEMDYAVADKLNELEVMA